MEINENSAELIGALIGDGYTYRNNRKYQIGYVGHPVTDKEYFEYLKELIKKEWRKDPKIKFRERGLRMVINSKEVCSFLLDELKIITGKEKSRDITIPSQILSDWSLTKSTIRGIFDTDGTVFAVKKPRVDQYPSIELTTISERLAKQIKQILETQGFRVSKIWSFKQKSINLCYRFSLHGQRNLQKWLDLIGFSNPYKQQRATSYIKMGGEGIEPPTPRALTRNSTC